MAITDQTTAPNEPEHADLPSADQPVRGKAARKARRLDKLQHRSDQSATALQERQDDYDSAKEARRSKREKAARSRDPKPPRVSGRMQPWALSEVVNHVTVYAAGSAKPRMIAWYSLDPQMWSFRSVADGEALIDAQAAQLAELTGRTIYGRVTTRPYPISTWARTNWENAPDPGGPDDPYARLLQRDQEHLRSRSQVDKLVYYGVDLGSLPAGIGLVSHIVSGATQRALSALQDRLDSLDRVMAGTGIEAVPAIGEDMAWLLSRSFALGCPTPVQDAVSTTRWTPEDLAEWIAAVDWSAKPVATSTRITSVIGSRPVTRHVIVLTVGRMSDMDIPATETPWIARTDRLPFPVEWSWRVEVRPSESTTKEMQKLSQRIAAQIEHYAVDHELTPPRQLARQHNRALEIDDEMRAGFDGLSTRTRGWYRIAVSGRTEEEALSRAKAVQDLYKPGLKIERELDQFRLAREFVPGEPLANRGHIRHLPITTVASGVPAATSEVGDKRGSYIGVTAGFAERAVTFDPWFLPEVVEASGLVPVVGGLGSGKSYFCGGLIYKTCLSGVPWTVMDPSGLLGNLTRIPDLAGISREINLLESAPGSLNPYALVQEPRPEWYEGEDDPISALRLAQSAAEGTRRDLVYDTLRWCLPYATALREDVQTILRDAIGAVDATTHTTTEPVLRQLDRMGTQDESARMIYNRLTEAKDRELSRLFFATEADHSLHDSGTRLTVFNLRGLIQADESKPREEWTYDELMSRPLMTLAAWCALRAIYRMDFNQRKGIMLDEAHEITKVGTGSTLIQKISTDTRKHDICALVATQNAANVLGQNIANFVGACFVGRTQDAQAQADAIRLLGLPVGVGYEAELPRLSPRRRRSGERLAYREFIYRDGLGGDDGRGGIEKIRVDYSNHPDLATALDTTPNASKQRGGAPTDDELSRDEGQ